MRDFTKWMDAEDGIKIDSISKVQTNTCKYAIVHL